MSSGDSNSAGLLRYLPKNFNLSQINFNDPTNRKEEIYILNIICLSLSTLAVILRLYSRFLIVRKIGLDDVLILFALLCSAALSGFVVATAKFYGLGRHIWTLDITKISTTAKSLTKMLYCISILYTATITAVKCSILCFYLKLGTSRTKFRYVTIALLTLVCALCFIGIFVVIFQCRPVHAAWNFALKNRQCIYIKKFYYGQAAMNIFTDFAIYVLPMPMLWKMLLPARQRFMVCGLLGIGLFVCIAGILRMFYLVRDVGASIDLTWVMINVVNWSVLEANIGILCASIPSIKPLVVYLFPRLLGTLHSKNSKSPSISFIKNSKNSNPSHEESASKRSNSRSAIGGSQDPQVSPDDASEESARCLKVAAKGVREIVKTPLAPVSRMLSTHVGSRIRSKLDSTGQSRMDDNEEMQIHQQHQHQQSRSPEDLAELQLPPHALPPPNLQPIRSPEEEEQMFRHLVLSASKVPELSEASASRRASRATSYMPWPLTRHSTAGSLFTTTIPERDSKYSDTKRSSSISSKMDNESHKSLPTHGTFFWS